MWLWVGLSQRLHPLMTLTVSVPDKPRVQKPPWWLHVDPFLMLSALAVTVMGTVLVYSATRGGLGGLEDPDRSVVTRQAFFAAFGVLVGTVAAFVTPGHLKRYWPIAFAVFCVALWAVLQFGVEVNGTRGWFSFGPLRFQPSEIGKLVVIVGLAFVLSPGSGVVSLLRLLAALAVTTVPIGLLLLQPDLGTTLVYVAVAVVVLVVSGVRARWLVALALLALLGTVAVFQSDALAEYQQARLTVFLADPSEVSPAAAEYAYNAKQARIAVGNGGLNGQGLFEGTQTQSDLVPFQETDFIFTVAGEELGFVGSSLLLGLYALMLFRIWRTAQVASGQPGRLICVGVFAMFLFQLFQAVGMTMEMMPVTGIPLPLVSYGGSSMLTSMLALGLVAGVYRRHLDPEPMRVR